MYTKNNFSIEELSIHSSHFPKALLEISEPPKTIYTKGILKETDAPCIALVGTRKASQESLSLAHLWGYELAARGWIIVSGLAYGIDRAAHEGALEAGGITWAVLAHGLDTVYPPEHTSLAQKILESNGCLISEYAPKTPPLPHQFLARNRIISGLCAAVCIIEAPQRSGALATARFAIEQGKEVFVVPGSVSSPQFKGSHALIRDGARLVSECAHIIEDLNFDSTTITQHTIYRETDTPKERAIIEALKNSTRPLSVDTLIEITRLSAQEVQSTITLLCAHGRIKETDAQMYILEEY